MKSRFGISAVLFSLGLMVLATSAKADPKVTMVVQKKDGILIVFDKPIQGKHQLFIARDDDFIHNPGLKDPNQDIKNLKPYLEWFAKSYSHLAEGDQENIARSTKIINELAQEKDVDPSHVMDEKELLNAFNQTYRDDIERARFYKEAAARIAE